MDYEKLYKEALERARELYDNLINEGTLATSKGIESIFPELLETEDERIRKELLEHCINRRDGKQICVDASDYRRWAAWLEKQGEQKPWSEEDEANMDAVWKACGQVYGTKYQSVLGDWLKSIKPNHWKPSEEILKSLPKWKKVDSNPPKVQYNLQGKRLYKNGEYYIELSDLEALPKEE